MLIVRVAWRGLSVLGLSSATLPHRCPTASYYSTEVGSNGGSSNASTPKQTKSSRMLQKIRRTDSDKRKETYGPFRCQAYRTSEMYEFPILQNILASKKFSPTIFTDVIHVQYRSEQNDDSNPLFGKNVFFFKEHGSFVCWGTSYSEEKDLLTTVTTSERGGSLATPIYEETDCFIDENGVTRVSTQGDIYLQMGIPESEKLQQLLAFSYALVNSLELEHREEMLENILGKVEPLFEDIIKRPPTAVQCHDIMAREIALRGKINLHSALMDTPDLYWEEHDLEKLFEAMRNSLDIPRRLGKLNHRLEHLHQMIEVLKHDRQERLSTKLEIWIVILIFVEILCSLAEKSVFWENFRWHHLWEGFPKKTEEKQNDT